MSAKYVVVRKAPLSSFKVSVGLVLSFFLLIHRIQVAHEVVETKEPSGNVLDF